MNLVFLKPGGVNNDNVKDEHFILHLKITIYKNRLDIPPLISYIQMKTSISYFLGILLSVCRTISFPPHKSTKTIHWKNRVVGRSQEFKQPVSKSNKHVTVIFLHSSPVNSLSVVF